METTMTQAIDEHTPFQPPLTSGKTAVALSATVDRLKQIVAEAGDHLLLGDGPVNPDHALLELCADALHWLKQEKAEQTFREVTAWSPQGAWQQSLRDEEVYRKAAQRYLRKAAKISAKTPAGIYAKAMLARCTRTGAAGLAMSLADDFLGIPELRASIWPNEGGGLA
jgi:hypothetical protein